VVTMLPMPIWFYDRTGSACSHWKPMPIKCVGLSKVVLALLFFGGSGGVVSGERYHM
jgi:hypothetical protein